MGKRRLLLTLLLALCTPAPAWAGLSEAVTLDTLVEESERVVVGTVMESHSTREYWRGRSRIVTYSRVRVDQDLLAQGKESEVMVRTLGGRVGDIAEIVHGAARLDRSKPAVLFLRALSPAATDSPTAFRIVAETQGAYPLVRDNNRRWTVQPSRDLAMLLGQLRSSALFQLRGRSLDQVKDLIGQSKLRLKSRAP